jgi:NifU-like protein involved in Fe-S cluster formation
MSLDPYSPLVRELFAHPAHAGTLTDAVSSTADAEGIRLQLSAKCDKGRIRELRYRAYGCPHLIAACELFCSTFEGRPTTELGSIRATDIMRKLSVPVEKTGRILVLEDAIRSLERSIGDTDVIHTS